MRRAAWAALLVLALLAGGCATRPDPALHRDDRRQHAAGGFAVGAAAAVAVEYLPATRDWPRWKKAVAATATAAAVGLAKEAIDSAGCGCAELGDATATAVGGAAGAIAFTWVWEF